MKILYVSNHNPHFINSNIYREKAFQELGHDLIFFEERDYVIPGRIRSRVPALQSWEQKRINQKILKLALNEKPDFVLFVGGSITNSETLDSLKSNGIKSVLWTTDYPGKHFENIRRTAKLYNHVFCSGSEAIDILEHDDVGLIHFLPFACDPQYHKHVEISSKEKEASAKIVFVGSYYPNRAKTLESIADLDLKIWGPYWDRMDSHSPLQGKVINERLNFDEWVKIYSAADIVLVIHLDQDGIPCHQVSPKIYEALSCRSFVITDAQKDIKTIFKNGTHLVTFSDEQDLRAKVLHYLDHSSERLTIAKQGQDFVLDKHTYKDRISELISIVS